MSSLNSQIPKFATPILCIGRKSSCLLSSLIWVFLGILGKCWHVPQVWTAFCWSSQLDGLLWPTASLFRPPLTNFNIQLNCCWQHHLKWMSLKNKTRSGHTWLKSSGWQKEITMLMRKKLKMNIGGYILVLWRTQPKPWNLWMFPYLEKESF